MILLEPMYLEDLQGDQYFAHAVVTRDRRVNGEKEISLSITKDHWNEEYFDNLDHHWKVNFDGEEYVVMIPKGRPRGKKAVKELNAVHRFFIDMRDDWQYESISGSRTLSDRLNFVFSGTGYNFVIVDSFTAQDMENFGDSSRLDLFQNVLEQYEAEFELIGNTVYMRKQIGRDTDFQYRHKLNLKDINVETDATNFSTYGEGFGADGLHITYTSPLAAIYGIKHHPPVRDDRYTKADSLTARVKKEVDESLVFSITIDIADLRKQGYAEAQPNEGDRIFVIDERLAINIETRIVEISEVFDVKGNVISVKVTLSNAGIRDSYQSQLSDTVKQLQDLMEGRGKLPYNVLDDAVKLATEALQKAQTELLFENGIVAVSKNNPNLLVVVNSAGIGVSTDGGQTFQNAITAFGVNTNLLTAGAIHTNSIQIIGTESFFFWDGNEFNAIDPNNTDKYVKITPGYLDISGGAVRIKRPDGFSVINDGMANFDFSLFFTMPWHLTNGVYHEGRWFKQANTEYGEAGYYSIEHTARYLYLQLAFYADDGNGGYISIEGSGATADEVYTTFYTNHSIGNTYATYGKVFAIDLGVPDGGQKSLYVRIKSDDATKTISVRHIRAYMRG